MGEAMISIFDTSTSPTNTKFLSTTLWVKSFLDMFSNKKVRVDFVTDKFDCENPLEVLSVLDSFRESISPSWSFYQDYGSAADHLMKLLTKDNSIFKPDKDRLCTSQISYSSLFTLIDNVSKSSYWKSHSHHQSNNCHRNNVSDNGDYYSVVEDTIKEEPCDEISVNSELNNVDISSDNTVQHLCEFNFDEGEFDTGDMYNTNPQVTDDPLSDKTLNDLNHKLSPSLSEQTIHKRLDKLENMTDKICLMVKDLSSGRTTSSEATVTHSTLRPATTLEELEEICCYNDTVFLLSRAISGCILSHAIRRMVRMVFSKELAMRFSFTGMGSQRKRNKLQFKDTKMYFIMIDALHSAKVDEGNNRYTIDKMMMSTFRTISDWNGRKRKISSVEDKLNISEESTIKL